MTEAASAGTEHGIGEESEANTVLRERHQLAKEIDAGRLMKFANVGMTGTDSILNWHSAEPKVKDYTGVW